MRTKATNIKIIYSGEYLESYLYKERLLLYNFLTSKYKKAKEKIIVVDEESRLRKLKSRMQSMQRASSQLRRLINRNIRRWYKPNGKAYPPVFATFTFKNNVFDIPTANIIFSKFIKRLNYFITDGTKNAQLKYVVVTEFQDLNRKGVIHYHTIFFNLPYVWGDKLADIWDQGMVDIKLVQKIKNLGAYITKYLSKNFEDERLDGHKKYFSSRKLIKPVEIKNPVEATKIINALPKESIIREREYESEYQGKVVYTQYKIDDQDALTSLFPELQ